MVHDGAAPGWSTNPPRAGHADCSDHGHHHCHHCHYHHDHHHHHHRLRTAVMLNAGTLVQTNNPTPKYGPAIGSSAN